MSTNMQKYSIANQTDAIADYAQIHGMQVVRTFEDGGVSGLKMTNRKGLKELLAAVQGGLADFKFVLVYDVSRWGRFQNTDAAAYYDYHCCVNGVPVIYIAEGFGTDGSVMASIYKHMKRAMAADYSKDLSAKISAGKSRLARLGFFMGGGGKYGLRRLVVTSAGKPRMLLEPGERKAMQTDRIILVPSSPKEVSTVRRIFQMFLQKNMTASAIEKVLRGEGIKDRSGTYLSRHIVMSMLACEAYVGNNVWGQRSAYLGGPRVMRPKENWSRKDCCFEPIIDAHTFELVQAKIDAGKRKISRERLLADLERTLAIHGRISGRLVVEDGGRCAGTYRKVFGGMPAAAREIGYNPDLTRAHDDRGLLDFLSYSLMQEVAEALIQSGCNVRFDLQKYCLTVNESRTVAFKVAQLSKRRSADIWITPRRMKERFDHLVFARMNTDRSTVKDFLVVPRHAQGTFPQSTRFDEQEIVRRVRCKTLRGFVESFCTRKTTTSKP